jgi:hypothetical protein
MKPIKFNLSEENINCLKVWCKIRGLANMRRNLLIKTDKNKNIIIVFINLSAISRDHHIIIDIKQKSKERFMFKIDEMKIKTKKDSVKEDSFSHWITPVIIPPIDDYKVRFFKSNNKILMEMRSKHSNFTFAFQVYQVPMKSMNTKIN